MNLERDASNYDIKSSRTCRLTMTDIILGNCYGIRPGVGGYVFEERQTRKVVRRMKLLS